MSPATTTPPRLSLGARSALALARGLAPVLGAARAEWLVARSYALLYLARHYLGAQYAKASLGIFWVALAPLLLAGVYVPIFLYVYPTHLDIPGHDTPLDYALYCLVGLMAWATAQDAIGQGTGALTNNASIVRHAPTPPAMLPIVKVLGSFAGFGVGLAVFVLVLVLAGQSPGVRLLLLPVTYALLFAAVLGLVLALSILSAYLRDLALALPTLLAIEFFAAPIVYAPTGKWPAQLQLAIAANPFTPFLALLRAALFSWEPFAWSDLGLAVAWAAGALVVGGLVFRRLEGGLGDVL